MNKCDLCDKNFQSKCHLERHKNNKRSCKKLKNLYNCDLCKINFKYESELERHNHSKKHIINNNIHIENQTNNIILCH